MPSGEEWRYLRQANDTTSTASVTNSTENGPCREQARTHEVQRHCSKSAISEAVTPTRGQTLSPNREKSRVAEHVHTSNQNIASKDIRRVSRWTTTHGTETSQAGTASSETERSTNCWTICCGSTQGTEKATRYDDEPQHHHPTSWDQQESAQHVDMTSRRHNRESKVKH